MLLKTEAPVSTKNNNTTWLYVQPDYVKCSEAILFTNSFIQNLSLLAHT